MVAVAIKNYVYNYFTILRIVIRQVWLQGRLQITLLRFNEPIKLGLISFQELQIPPDKPLGLLENNPPQALMEG